MSVSRIDGRKQDELRSIRITPYPQRDPMGSVLIEWGHTHVICSVNVEEKIPNWMNGPEASGWITAEYGMLPGSSDKRIHRDRIRNTGRTHEIQRLIGRSIRASVPDLKSLGMRTFQIDCDVLQADGGTRVASITGSYLALRLALKRLQEKRLVREAPKTLLVSAVSLGLLGGNLLLDLNYSEDVKADVDSNLVMNEKNEFIEIQGTAEKGTFNKDQLAQMVEFGSLGCQKLFDLQRKYLKEWGLL